jgi:endogenous inhibitor of DNA gyrase (YacG/DUF329 family)
MSHNELVSCLWCQTAFTAKVTKQKRKFCTKRCGQLWHLERRHEQQRPQAEIDPNPYKSSFGGDMI